MKKNTHLLVAIMAAALLVTLYPTSAYSEPETLRVPFRVYVKQSGAAWTPRGVQLPEWIRGTLTVIVETYAPVVGAGVGTSGAAEYALYANGTLILSHTYNIWQLNPNYSLPPGVWNLTLRYALSSPTQGLFYGGISLTMLENGYVYFFDDEPRFWIPLIPTPAKYLDVRVFVETTAGTIFSFTPNWDQETVVLNVVADLFGEEEYISRVLNSTYMPVLGTFEGYSTYRPSWHSRATQEMSVYFMNHTTVDSFEFYFSNYYTNTGYYFFAWFTGRIPYDFWGKMNELPMFPLFLRFAHISSEEDTWLYEDTTGVVYTRDWYETAWNIKLDFGNLTMSWVFSDGISTYVLSEFPKVIPKGFKVVNAISYDEPLPNTPDVIAYVTAYIIIPREYFTGSFFNGIYSTSPSGVRKLGFAAEEPGVYNLSLYTFAELAPSLTEFIEDEIPTLLGIKIDDMVTVKDVIVHVNPLGILPGFGWSVAEPLTTPRLKVRIGNVTVHSLPLIYVLPNATVKPGIGMLENVSEADTVISINVLLPVVTRATDNAQVSAFGANSLSINATTDAVTIQVDLPSLIIASVPEMPVSVKGPRGEEVPFMTVRGSYYAVFNATQPGTYTILFSEQTSEGEQQPSQPPPSQPSFPVELPPWVFYALAVLALLFVAVLVATRHAIADARRFVRRRR
ncbi:MAG: hypothetical protein QXT28_08630 [Thermofilaceae archaeon]